MSDVLVAARSYLTNEDGTFGVLTVIVLALACVVMLAVMISYPEASEALALVG